ncbi:hypothetical protein C5167_034101 [Papaver somniferum]|uniref:Uncharacterized protein n=1 Tax=Papaver somniferum TaxID=3469 RepID=A0A4Y7KG45_PAPSO|nr:hypothetical protein C5167_034101 [Papaver somniferum]
MKTEFAGDGGKGQPDDYILQSSGYRVQLVVTQTN